MTDVDLKCGYWQIKLDPEDREKTAFVIGCQFYQFKVNCFGLCNAPATFIRAMNLVLQGLVGKICVVYLDDIIIFGKTFEEHLRNLELVFSRLAEANLKLIIKNANFFKHEVLFLGHVVDGKGFKCNPEKIKDVVEWPIPKKVVKVEAFLGLCNYYRKYVAGFASIVKPLYKLTERGMGNGRKRKGVGLKSDFCWNQECQQAFDILQANLSSSPILGSPIRGDFILDTDASDTAIGATLSQVQGADVKVIAYFSKCLNKAEKNYCVTRRELLAVVKAVNHINHYLLGRKFLLRTDHAALKWWFFSSFILLWIRY